MANRLAGATSPYLLQHADNPVDWREWSPAVFEEARERDVPVLLSVGYAACHWCHVMAHESFEDAETAAYMNAHFVNVKVDREERPDVDAVYMQATTAMTGQGGWPMTCVLDHDGTPFFAGTYFPDRPRHGLPSFRQVLEGLSEAWRDRGDDVRRVAGQVRDHLQQSRSLAGGAVDRALVDGAVETLARDFDEVAAGFGDAPKFPPSMVLEFLLRHAARRGTGADPASRMLDRTLEAMARGGLHDQLGGGFARYSVDRHWVVPHFEKMLYDNALLLRVYAGWSATAATAGGRDLGRRVALVADDFLLAEMTTPEGGFASALDADSEGEEGTFYVWTPTQLEAALGPEDAAWAADLLRVTREGTFERGASTLQLPVEPDDAERWRAVRQRLLEGRSLRERPARDDKVVAAWNGLAIGALARTGMLLGQEPYVAAATRAAHLLWNVHVVDDRLRRVSRDGVVGAPVGVLEDYACLAEGYLVLAQATADAVWVERAGWLLDTALDLFAEDGSGGFHDTARDAERLVARPRDPSDNASPSGHSAMIHALSTYAALTGSGHHREAAEHALSAVATLVERVPRFAGWALAAAESMLEGPDEVVVVHAGDEAGDELSRRARRAPGAVSLVVTPDRVADAGIPLLEGRTLVDGRSAAYVCRHLVCDRPVTDPADLAS